MKRPIKENLRRMQLIADLFPEDAFYSMECTEYQVKLQGDKTDALIKRLIDLKFKVVNLAGGIQVYERGIYQITL